MSHRIVFLDRARLLGQRRVQCDDVARLEHLLPRRVQRSQPGLPLVRGEYRHHAEGPRERDRVLTEHALADDAQPRAAQVADRMVEEQNCPDCCQRTR